MASARPAARPGQGPTRSPHIPDLDGAGRPGGRAAPGNRTSSGGTTAPVERHHRWTDRNVLIVADRRTRHRDDHAGRAPRRSRTEDGR
ncbi:hypothetical protein Ae263Ps1_4923c [Pseudonocardia sp. Ae263_Ps1]|nr:hypothetical protein Ae263Ps1_4923c [Pseudonocardia sp. Ae263_Ps1]